MPAVFHEFDDDAGLVGELAGRIVAELGAAIARRGRATLAVSGGSTPRPLFAALAAAPMNWARVAVTLVDERWVPEDHPDSNARLVRETLLRDHAAAARFTGHRLDGADAFGAEAAVAARLRDFAEGIDVTVLGMGEDGHTASFFPGAESLPRALDPDGDELCVTVRPPAAPHDRTTLTLAALLRSRRLYLHIVGTGKRDVLRRALASETSPALPVATLVRCSAVPVDVYYRPGN